MGRTRLLRSMLLITALLILLAVSTGHEVKGSVQQSEFSVNVQPGISQVSFYVSIFQNLTTLVGSFALPQAHSVLMGSNSTKTAEVLQSALRTKSPSAELKGLRLEATSTPWSNATGIQWLNISLSFGIGGVSLDNNGITQFDTAWRSFVVSSNVSMGGLEANNIGSAYLAGTAVPLSKLSNTKFFAFSYHVNGVAVSLSHLSGRLPAVSVFNFSSLAVPLSHWALAYNSTNNSIAWSLEPLPTYGFQVVENVQEPQPLRITYGLTYNFHMASITAPLRSTVRGDTIIVVFGDTQATMMGLIIASVSFLSVATIFYEKRVLNKMGGKKRQR